MYTDKVMEKFSRPKHTKKMQNPDGVGTVGNAKCGDIMKVFIKVDKKKYGKEFIKKVSFLTFGCVAAISSCEMVCEIAEGKNLEDAEKITNKDIAKALGGLPVEKLHCSNLGADALRAAIRDYRSKKK